MNIRVTLADDHPLIILAGRHILRDDPDVVIVGEARDPKSLFDCLQRTPCDVLVTDFSMPKAPRQDGLAMLKALRSQFPAVRVVVLTMLENSALFNDMRLAGALGVLNKRDDISELPVAVRAAYQGRPYLGEFVRKGIEASEDAVPGNAEPAALTPKESEVIRLYVNGMTTSEVANHLHRSVTTVSTQKNSAMRKLGLSNDAELYDYALQHGLRS